MIFLFFGLQVLQIINFLTQGLEGQCIGNANQGQSGGSCSDKISISDEEIFSIGQQLWNEDENRLQVGLNLQAKSARNKADRATGPLCSTIPTEIFRLPIYKDFISLFDNYIADDSKREEITATERGEMEALLDTIVKTGPFRVVHEFLASKGLVTKDVSKFREELKNTWFLPYKRSKALSSSGAEHVLIGETKDDKVSGFHNWVRYCLLEKDQNINYLGYERILDLDGYPLCDAHLLHICEMQGSKYLASPNAHQVIQAYLVQASFLWNNHLKSGGSFFVGTSPAFEISIFTLCFYARPNQKCKLKLNGHPLKVQTYNINYDGKKMVGSAYPEF